MAGTVNLRADGTADVTISCAMDLTSVVTTGTTKDVITTETTAIDVKR